MNESYKPESADERMQNELSELVEKESYTGEEMREAYYQICKVSEVSKSNDRINLLKERMNEMLSQHFPMNRLVSTIEALDEIDNAEDKYKDFVKKLDISNNEKTVLNSIVERKRNGILECHVDDEPVATVEISENMSSRATALMLLYHLSDIINEISEKYSLESVKISFWFDAE